MISPRKYSHSAEVAREILEVVPHFMAALRADMRSCDAAEHPAHFRALMRVAHGPLTVGELARAFDVSAPTASRTISHLEERGWVRRLPDAADRRRQPIELTDAGRTRLADAMSAMESRVASMLSDTSPQDLQRLTRGLAVLREALKGKS